MLLPYLFTSVVSAKDSMRPPRELEAALVPRVTPVSSAPPQLNILACGVLGSYSVVLAVNSYMFTSLSYITLNVLRRALNTDFRGVFIRVPFQTNGKTLD